MPKVTEEKYKQRNILNARVTRWFPELKDKYPVQFGGKRNKFYFLGHPITPTTSKRK